MVCFMVLAGLIFFIIPGIIAVVFLFLSIFCVVENRTWSIRGAIVESFKISKKSFIFVFINYLFVGIIIASFISFIKIHVPVEYVSFALLVFVVLVLPLVFSACYVIYKNAKGNYGEEIIIETKEKNRVSLIFIISVIIPISLVYLFFNLITVLFSGHIFH